MRTESKKLYHLKGKEAYVLYWEQVYKCRPRFSTVQTIDLNLEVIIDDAQTILAFRHDMPEDMKEMVLNIGHWHISNQDCLCPEVIHELKNLMGKLRKGISMN